MGMVCIFSSFNYDFVSWIWVTSKLISVTVFIFHSANANTWWPLCKVAYFHEILQYFLGLKQNFMPLQLIKSHIIIWIHIAILKCQNWWLITKKYYLFMTRNSRCIHHKSMHFIIINEKRLLRNMIFLTNLQKLKMVFILWKLLQLWVFPLQIHDFLVQLSNHCLVPLLGFSELFFNVWLQFTMNLFHFIHQSVEKLLAVFNLFVCFHLF